MSPFLILSSVFFLIIGIYSLYQAWRSFRFEIVIPLPAEYLDVWICRLVGKHQAIRLSWDHKQRGFLFLIAGMVCIIAALNFLFPGFRSIFFIDLSHWGPSTWIKISILLAAYVAYIAIMLKKRLLVYLLIGLALGFIGAYFLYTGAIDNEPIPMAIIRASNFFIPVSVAVPISLYFYRQGLRDRRKG